MSRFRPMAATQAGGAGGNSGKEKAGQRACERQLLRVREGQREMGQRWTDKLTQTSRERKSLGSRE